jgi:regulator of protease activity HflC (stomatin/prohibitin superfamily)
MLLWKTVDIADNKRALLYRRDRFERVLEPGRHRIAGKVRLETYEITDLVFKHNNAKYFMHSYAEKLSAYLDSVELNDTQVGLVYCDRHLADVLGPGSFYAFWRGVEDVHVEIIDIDEAYQIDEKLLGLLGRGWKIGSSKEVIQAISYNEIPDEHVGLLLVNGKLEQILKPGNYGFWKYNRAVVVKLLDMRLQVAEVNGQEILTKDKVSLRVNLSASYRISAPEIVALKLNDYAGFIYRELQLRLREAVGTKTLDQLLEDKDSLNAVIAESVRSKFKEYGVELQGVGVKDIILPGDMKVILNQVVEAQKEAEANLIKRREETQAMRSLHNTAKMMENNPTLLRLKELESLERITERIDKISVYGGLDGVLHDLVKLAPAAHGR